MANVAPKSAERKPRQDAQRNRERILQVAKEAFTNFGAEASLDEIARQSGVGAGTLYRHFPTRDALIEAVYRNEVEKLASAAREFARTMPPMQALRSWMLLFVDHIAQKRIIAPALNSIVGGPEKLYEGGRSVMESAVRALFQRGMESGEIRPDLEPYDLIRALIGVAFTASGPGWEDGARRLVEVLLQGSRPAGETPSASNLNR